MRCLVPLAVSAKTHTWEAGLLPDVQGTAFHNLSLGASTRHLGMNCGLTRVGHHLHVDLRCYMSTKHWSMGSDIHSRLMPCKVSRGRPKGFTTHQARLKTSKCSSATVTWTKTGSWLARNLGWGGPKHCTEAFAETCTPHQVIELVQFGEGGFVIEVLPRTAAAQGVDFLRSKTQTSPKRTAKASERTREPCKTSHVPTHVARRIT